MLSIEEQCHYLLVDIYEMQNAVNLHGILPNPGTKQFKKCLRSAIGYLKNRNEISKIEYIEQKYSHILKSKI